MKNRKIITVLMVLTIAFTLMGSTLAYWNWTSASNKKTNVVFTVTGDFSCSADGGGNLTSNDIILAPAHCDNATYALKRKITTSVTTQRDKVVNLDLWLNVNSISQNLTQTSNFKWVITKNENTCSGAINQGDFTNIQNNKINLLEDVEYATLDDTYYLYIWLDYTETSTNSMNGSFNFSLDGECTDSGKEKTYLNNNWTALTNANINYKTQVTDIYYVYDNDLPSGIKDNNEGEFDFGTTTAKPITGYLIENTDQGAEPDTYKLYVSSRYKIYVQNLVLAYFQMTALKNITFSNFDTSAITGLNQTFEGCSSLISLDLRRFNTSNVTTMYYAFRNCSNLTNLYLSNIDTSNVTNMQGTFFGCSSLTSIDLSSFNTSSVTNMQSMFYYCDDLVNLDLSNFDTHLVNNMGFMFQNCSSLVSLDLSHFDTHLVNNMSNMFSGCSDLVLLNIINFNTANVEDMHDMFRGCSGLTSLDLSSFNTSGATNMSTMFAFCSALRTIYVSNTWSTSANTGQTSSFFSNCNSLVGGSGTTYSSSDMSYARIDNPPNNPGYLTYKAYTPPSSGN